jgi:adenosylhomocysteinase
MDMSFATQALGLVYMTQNYKELKNEVYNVPHEIDSEIAMIKLRSMGVTIDTLTEEQIKYVTGWEEGT